MNEEEKKVHAHLSRVLQGLKVLLDHEHEISSGILPAAIDASAFTFEQGICWYTSQLSRHGLYTTLGGNLLHDIPERWDLYSGCPAYPVPSNDRNLNHKDVYRLHKGNMWSNHTIYGNHRWGLVKFYIKTLETIITEDSIMPLDQLRSCL